MKDSKPCPIWEFNLRFMILERPSPQISKSESVPWATDEKEMLDLVPNNPATEN